MLLLEQEAARRLEQSVDAAEVSSSSSGADASAPMPCPHLQRRMAQSVLGRHERRAAVPAPCPGCFGAILGGCGGSLMWALGCANMVCLCVAWGALAEQCLRHFHHNATLRRSPPSSDEDDACDDTTPWGLDPDTIERTTVLSTGENLVGLGSENCKCMICVDFFSKSDLIRTLPCLHRYHRHCIDEWLRRNRHCPICKHDVTDTDVRRLEGACTLSSSSRRMWPVARLRRSWRRRRAAPAPRPLQFWEALERTSR